MRVAYCPSNEPEERGGLEPADVDDGRVRARHPQRNLGWTAPEVGYAYGLIFLFCGTGGVIAGGWLADRQFARGQLDAHLRTVRLSAFAALPFVITFPLMTDGRAAVALLAPAVFFGTMAFGAGPSLIPVICPPRMRGLLIAIYLLKIGRAHV